MGVYKQISSNHKTIMEMEEDIIIISQQTMWVMETRIISNSLEEHIKVRMLTSSKIIISRIKIRIEVHQLSLTFKASTAKCSSNPRTSPIQLTTMEP